MARKMSKSEGNFYTLRDLLLKGYKASAIRLALISVPYRHQLNFTFDGLTEATNAIERLRTFHQRLTSGKSRSRSRIPPSSRPRQKPKPTIVPRSPTTSTPPRPAHPSSTWSAPPTLPSTRASFFAGDREAILAVLASFDAVFDVIEDRDAEPTRRALEWAEQSGRMTDVAPELLARQGLTDEAIDALVAERTQAKKQRNFARADQIRNELAEKGIVIEDSKDGVRWKRK